MISFVKIRRLCTAIGKLGSLRWNGITGTWSCGNRGKSLARNYQTKTFSRCNYIAEWKNLISCIERDLKPLVTGLDGLKVLEIIEASRRSDKSKGGSKFAMQISFEIYIR